MKRSANATGRSRITISEVDATLMRTDSVQAQISVRLETSALEPFTDSYPNATLWAEVRGGIYRHRMSLGTAASPNELVARPLPNHHLIPDHPTLRVTIVDPTTGRILSAANGIALTEVPGAEAARDWLLPVEFENLSGPAWRVVAEDPPLLQVDRRLKDEDDVRRSAFIALVLPEAVRQVVLEWYQEYHDDPDNPRSAAWKRKVRQLMNGETTPEFAGDEDERDKREKWEDFARRVSEAFASEIKATAMLDREWRDSA